MRKLSVVVNGISNSKRFLNNLFMEAGSEISAKVNNDVILFYDIDDEKTEKLYNILAKNFLTEFCRKTLVKIINKNCDYFSKDDKYQVWKMSMNCILKDEAENNSDYLYRINVVKSKLEEFFAHSGTVSVEGFVNFRLKELEDDLEYIAEDCVQEYLLELEYAEFVNMLKYFVSVQNPIYLAVDVIYDDNISIFGDGKNITYECLDDFNKDVVCTETNKDDFLLNSLISISPKRITIMEKNKKLNEEIKKTLLGIFGDKLKITTE